MSTHAQSERAMLILCVRIICWPASCFSLLRLRLQRPLCKMKALIIIACKKIQSCNLKFISHSVLQCFKHFWKCAYLHTGEELDENIHPSHLSVHLIQHWLA